MSFEVLNRNEILNPGGVYLIMRKSCVLVTSVRKEIKRALPARHCCLYLPVAQRKASDVHTVLQDIGPETTHEVSLELVSFLSYRLLTVLSMLHKRTGLLKGSVVNMRTKNCEDLM